MIGTPQWFLVFSVIKDILIVGIAGAGLFAIFFAKKQLDLIKNQSKETRDQFRIKNERESISLAIELSEKFPNIIKRSDKLTNENPQIFEKVQNLSSKFLGNILKSNNCRETISDKQFINIMSLLRPVRIELLQIANELEAISLYFVNGVADEEAVFPSLAPAFCYIIEIAYPILIRDRCISCGKCKSEIIDQRFELFSNSFKLYSIWKSRTLKSKAKHKIDTYIATQKELVSKSKPVKILGSEI
jgi:hypothetical protein